MHHGIFQFSSSPNEVHPGRISLSPRGEEGFLLLAGLIPLGISTILCIYDLLPKTTRCSFPPPSPHQQVNKKSFSSPPPPNTDRRGDGDDAELKIEIAFLLTSFWCWESYHFNFKRGKATENVIWMCALCEANVGAHFWRWRWLNFSDVLRSKGSFNVSVGSRLSECAFVGDSWRMCSVSLFEQAFFNGGKLTWGRALMCHRV